LQRPRDVPAHQDRRAPGPRRPRPDRADLVRERLAVPDALELLELLREAPPPVAERRLGGAVVLRARADAQPQHQPAAGERVHVAPPRGYLRASAFALEPEPPTLLSGAAVKSPSKTPSAAQSAASASRTNSSPKAIPSKQTAR